MQVYQTNAALGYDELVYLIKLKTSSTCVEGKRHDYLCIGMRNIHGWQVNYRIGNVVEKLEEFYVEKSDYKIKNSALYGTFLFDHFLKTFETK